MAEIIAETRLGIGVWDVSVLLATEGHGRKDNGGDDEVDGEVDVKRRRPAAGARRHPNLRDGREGQVEDVRHHCGPEERRGGYRSHAQKRQLRRPYCSLYRTLVRQQASLTLHFISQKGKRNGL